MAVMMKIGKIVKSAMAERRRRESAAASATSDAALRVHQRFDGGC
jgi:hypothetical protein